MDRQDLRRSGFKGGEGMVRWLSMALVVILGATGLPAAPADTGWQAVICRAIGDQGQALAPTQWFPAGWREVTAWFRGPRGTDRTRVEVRWLLNGTTVAAREVTLRPGRPGADRYTLGPGEALPLGVYEVLIRLDDREVARAAARVGGEAPREADTPSPSPAEDTSGLQRRDRTPGAPEASSPAEVTPPADPLPAGGAPAARPSPAAPEVPSAALAPSSLPVVRPSEAAPPVVLEGLEPPLAVESGTLAPTPPAPGALAAPAVTPEAVTLGQPSPPPGAAEDAATLPAEDTPPAGTPLGPRTAVGAGPQPLLSRGPREGGPPGTPAPSMVPPGRSAPPPAVPLIPRSRGPVAPIVAAVEPSTTIIPRHQDGAARRLPLTADRMAPAEPPPAEAAREAPVTVPLRPERPPVETDPADPGPAPAVTGEEPAAQPSTVPALPPAIGEPPGEAPLPTEPAVEEPPAEAAPAPAPPAETTPAPVTDPVVAPEPAPAPTGKLVVAGPQAADVIAEDAPPVKLSDEAVELYHVALEQVPEPPGLQPLWVMKVPDGRLWPPDSPTPFGLWAGEQPEVSPADLLLYSDHIDGVVPLYEVPLQEALVHAVRENEAGLLSMAREMYDARREAWQQSARNWQWMWYVRQVDLEPGDTLVGCLVDLRRARRAPEEFNPAAPEQVILLDEQGRRLEAGQLTLEMLHGIAPGLGMTEAEMPESDAAALRAALEGRGAAGLAAWTVPAAGRYQVWAALGMDKSRARCLVWTASHAEEE